MSRSQGPMKKLWIKKRVMNDFELPFKAQEVNTIPGFNLPYLTSILILLNLTLPYQNRIFSDWTLAYLFYFPPLI